MENKKTVNQNNGGIKIMMELPNCPKCGSPYTYEDGTMLICPAVRKVVMIPVS